MNKDELKAIYFSFFDQLLPEHAGKAKANYDHEYVSGIEPEDHENALMWGFEWSESPEDQPYWDKIHDDLMDESYPLQLTPQKITSEVKEFTDPHLTGVVPTTELPARNWFEQLKPEHREAALDLDYEDDQDDLTQYVSLAEALLGRRWKDSKDGLRFWERIYNQLFHGTYHTEASERMATQKDFDKLNELTAKLPTDAAERKEIPVYSGCVKYFGLALAAVARLSKKGNDQHNPGTPLHWDRSKSGDELDAMMRHVIDEDWTQVAWRALANLQKVEEERISNDRKD